MEGKVEANRDVMRLGNALQTPHKFCFFKSDTDRYADLLEGQTIVGATFHGGMLEIDTEDTMIVFSDGVTPRNLYDEKRKISAKAFFGH